MPDTPAAPTGTPATPAVDLTADATAAAAAAAAAPAAAPKTNWYDSYTPEDRGWAENRGLLNMPIDQALAATIKGHQNAERSLGVPAERRIDLPADQTLDGAMDPIYSRLGRPEAATDYKFSKAAADGSDADAVKFIQSALFTAGVSATNADAFFSSMKDWIQGNVDSDQNEAGISRSAAEHDLQLEWGSTTEANTALAKAAASKQGVDAEAFEKVIGALGYSQTMKLFQGIGKGFGEDEFLNGDGKGGTPAQTPEGAAAEITQLMDDDGFTKLLSEGDIGARKKWDALHLIKAAGMGRSGGPVQ
jgi:hypothetical protein